MNMWTMIVIIGVCRNGPAKPGGITPRHAAVRVRTKTSLNSCTSAWIKLDNELRDRVETLERIVTDNKDDLKRQFDHLDKAG